MKSKFIVYTTIAFFISLSVRCFGQDITEPPATFNLSIAQLKSFGYSGTGVNQSKQPITSKNDALEFIKRIANTTNDPSIASVHGQLGVYIRQLEQQEDDKFAVILIKHPLKLDRLFAGDGAGIDAQRNTLVANYSSLSTRKTTLSALIDAINMKVIAIENSTKLAGGAFDPTQLSPANVAELNNLKVLKTNTNDEIVFLDKQMAEKKVAFIKLSSEIEEEEKVEPMVLDHHYEEWTDYLYNVDKVLFVLVGGPNDIQKGKLKIDNLPSTLETSINQVIQVGAGLGLGLPVPVAPSIPGVQLKETMPITFLLVKRKKIKAPSNLQFVIDDKDKKYDFKVHEKMRFGLQLGVSASKITRKNFTIDQNNELTIKVDDDKKEEWKSNLYVLLEIVPWGRDIDRLEPIFSKNKDIKVFDFNRLGLIAGLKFSTNPLEALYGGLSYALSKTVSLNFGVSMHATPKDISKLPVGINASLDYLKENAETELKPKLFFGVSFSPLVIGRSLGVVK